MGLLVMTKQGSVKDIQRSTIYLFSVVKKYLYKWKKVYVAFIDYKKAFDCIDRDALWKVLEHFGIKGNMLATHKSIYSQVEG